MDDKRLAFMRAALVYHAPVHELGLLTLHIVVGKAQSRLWNEFIARYHYLGYTPLSGSQLRYHVLPVSRW